MQPELKILFEDDHLIAMEKPVYMPVQKDKTGDPDLMTLTEDLLSDRERKKNTLFLLHRLDRPVGGVVLFARNSRTAAILSEQIRLNQWGKEYLAIVRGEFAEPQGTLVHHLFKIEKLNFSKVVKPEHTGGKEARLSYDVIGQAHNQSLVRIQLETGRHHQIRVQFSFTGHPLVNDQKYGPKHHSFGPLSLWAFRLTVPHPVTRQNLTIQSVPPQKDGWEAYSSVLASLQS